MNNKCDGCKFYCNGRCFGEKDAPYVEYADCKGENNRPDTISNERAKEIIEYLKSIRTLFENGKLAIKALEERPKGKWIEERDKRGHLITRKCPICKAFHDGMIIKFCPYCGADMRGDAWKN